MSRLDRAAEQQVERTLAYLRTTINDLKQDQTFGSSNVRTYKVANPTSNVDIYLNNLTSTTPQCIEITLTPNTLGSNPVIAFDFAFSTVSSTEGNMYIHVDPLLPVAGVQKYRLTVLSAGATTPSIGFGFTFWTISPATFTCVAVTP